MTWWCHADVRGLTWQWQWALGDPWYMILWKRVKGDLEILFFKGGCLYFFFDINPGCWLGCVYFAPFVDLKKMLWTSGVHVPRDSLNKRKYESKTSKFDSCATCLLAMICIVKDRTAYAICWWESWIGETYTKLQSLVYVSLLTVGATNSGWISPVCERGDIHLFRYTSSMNRCRELAKAYAKTVTQLELLESPDGQGRWRMNTMLKRMALCCQCIKDEDQYWWLWEHWAFLCLWWQQATVFRICVCGSIYIDWNWRYDLWVQ